MCSMNNSSWVTFEDEGTPTSSPQKPLQSPRPQKVSVPRPNGLKLVLPPVGDPSWCSKTVVESPQMHYSLNESSCVPCNTPLCTPVGGVPSISSPFHCEPWEKHDFFRSLSSTSTASASDSGQDKTPQSKTVDWPSAFPSFQEEPGHFNPFWEGAGQSLDSGSSSSDSESGPSLPRFFIRTKDGHEPPRDQLQNSYSYICHKLEGLRAEEDQESEAGRHRERGVDTTIRLTCDIEREGPSLFVPQGLFRSQKRDGWSLMLRIPEKKNRMSSRQWGPIYLRLLAGGVLQMYYERGLEKPFKEFQLLPHCRLSNLKLEGYGEARKILTVKVEHFSYVEKKRYHPKLEVSHEAEVEQILKFGTTEHGDMEDLLVSMEEELFRLPPPHQQRRHYEEQELSLQITDHIWLQLDKDGTTKDRAATTQIHCLAFLNGAGDCFLALNDLGLLRFDSSYGSEGGHETWMEINDCHFHKCINEVEFKRSRLIKFSPPDACRVELMRYKTMALGCTEPPFSVKAVVTVQGAYVELQAFLNMSPAFPSSTGMPDTQVLCENILIHVPVPGDWVKVSHTVALLRQRSLKARMNRNACLGSVSDAESQPVMQVSVGTVKYENVYSAIVWRIDRLPAKNMAVDHPHSFSCKLELGSDQEIPKDWYPFVTMECEMMGAFVSQTQIKSIGTVSDIQPLKHVTSWTRYHCQVEIEKKWIETELQKQSSTPGTLATFSFPPGITYPVQIPAGVTLQTSSGQLYKVNVPVMVTQAPVGQCAFAHPTQRVVERREVPAPQTAQSLKVPALVKTIPPPQKLEQHVAPAISHPQEPLPVPPAVDPQPAVMVPDNSFTDEFNLDGIEFSPQPVNNPSSVSTESIGFELKTEGPLAEGSEFRANEIEDVLQELVKEERGVMATIAGTTNTPPNLDRPYLKLDLDYNFNALSDIVQLDGPADSEEMGGPIGENEFLGIINAEALKALEEIDGSSDDENSSSDGDLPDELVDMKDEDPLNSGDDVSEQDIPDLFDTDNVIVCQYDKIHRSKNRWKFYLKDGVMCYGGKDYVFSKAVGEAEW
ncbi:stonin-1 [Aplochiton taeniatus]